MTWLKNLYIGLALVFIAFAPGKCENEAEQNFAVELTTNSFSSAIDTNNHFVMFFAPWCGHCKRLHPLWEELAEMLNVKEDPNVVIAKVDCTKEQELCGEHEVTGYPTLKLFKFAAKEPIKFKGTRDLQAITEFINEHLNEENNEDSSEDSDNSDDDGENKKPVEVQKARIPIELTEDSFPKHVSNGNHFIKFYAPWCSFCQRLAPTWEELAEALKHDTSVSISKIDCTLYRQVCQDFEVKGYPTLLWIEDGKKIEKYSGERTLNSLKSYIEKMTKTQSANNPSPIIEGNTDLKKEYVVQLTGEEFEKFIEEGVVFIKFYAPWCGHCQKLSPTWDDLAEKLKDSSVRIAKVDCTAATNKQLCTDQQVDGYPTLFAYKNGKKQKEYNGGRSTDSLQHYISKFLSHDEL